MTDEFVRHAVSFIAVILAFLIFFAGYKAGQFGWWWAGFSVLIMYAIVYALLEV